MRITVTQGPRGWLILEQKPTRELLSSDRRPMTWRAIRYALKHLVDEECSERPPKVYYSRAAAIPINEAMEIVG